MTAVIVALLILSLALNVWLLAVRWYDHRKPRQLTLDDARRRRRP